MTITDLTDTNFIFSCKPTEYFYDLWDYQFDATIGDETYYHDLNTAEIIQLRTNCKRILEVTNHIQGGN